MKFFDNPIYETIRLPAANLFGGAGVYTYIQGPPGSRGKIMHFQTAVTEDVTVAAAAVLIGTSSDTDKFLSRSVAVSSAGAVVVANESDLSSVFLDADTVIQIGTNGAATAGKADINIVIAWEAL